MDYHMIGLYILLAHLTGDYLIQSDWMANEKTKRWLPAIVHGVTYTIPFLLFVHSLPALAIICGTHILIDRFRLIKHLIWLKNLLGGSLSWEEANENNGYGKHVPIWMSTWLMIIADNTIHLLINTAAIAIFVL
jgi:hypothetical protein